MRHGHTEGAYWIGERIASMSIQQTMKRSDAVCATVKGAGRYDFNPWERYEDDAGYCLDAPTQILAGSHEHYRDGVAFCTLVNRS